jgi:galactokinase
VGGLPEWGGLGYEIPLFRGAFVGDVPPGSGLSSSAAIEAATALALATCFQLAVSRKDLAQMCQQAENAFVGVNSGIMDQYASLLCQAGSALFIDCRSLEAEPKNSPVRNFGARAMLSRRMRACWQR